MGLLRFRFFEETDHFFDGPDVIGDTSFHRGRDAQRLVHTREIVVDPMACSRTLRALMVKS